MSRSPSVLIGAGVAVLAIALAACGTTEAVVEKNVSSSSSSVSSAASAPASIAGSGSMGAPATSAGEPVSTGPIRITDGAGRTVTLDKPATKVVALEWAEAEIVASLGVMPVGVADVKGYTTWDAAVPLAEGVKDVGTRGEPSVDAILALDPDLILMTGGRAVSDQADKIGGEIPVLVSKGAEASRQLDRLADDVTMIAKATGTEDAAKQLMAAMDAKIADGKAAISAAGASGSPFLMADGWMEGSTVSIRMFGAGSQMSDTAEAIGLENAWTTKGDVEYGLGQTDVEGLAKMTNPDLRLFYSASEDDPFAEGLADNAIWKGLPFVKNQQLTKLDKGTWTFGGPKSVMFSVDQFVAAYQD